MTLKKVWVVCKAGGWRPYSVREPEIHYMHCPIIGLNEADDRNQNQTAYIW